MKTKNKKRKLPEIIARLGELEKECVIKYYDFSTVAELRNLLGCFNGDENCKFKIDNGYYEGDTPEALFVIEFDKTKIKLKVSSQKTEY